MLWEFARERATGACSGQKENKEDKKMNERKIERMRRGAKEQIESHISYMKSNLCKDKTKEYNELIYYILDLCLTTELITYEEWKKYKQICINIIECPFEL